MEGTLPDRNWTPPPSLILQAPRFEAESENEQQEIQQLREWQGNPLPLSLMEPRQENWWENALGGSVGAEEKESKSQEKCMSARNESQITNPTYMGAVPGNIERGDFERVPFGFSSQSLSQSSPLLLAPPPREGSEINPGAHDNDLEVSPPSSGSDAETLQQTPLITGGQGQVLFQVGGRGVVYRVNGRSGDVTIERVGRNLRGGGVRRVSPGSPIFSSFDPPPDK